MALNTAEIQSKSMRGGKRIGAGRPKRDIERWLAARGISPATATEVLAYADERRLWMRLFRSEDDSVVLRALAFLTQMRDGKPSQQINVTSQSITLTAGDIESARAIIREIRGELTNPSLGIAPSNSAATTATEPTAEVPRESGDRLMLGEGEGGKKGG